MSVISYSEEKIAMPGSTVYYSVLYTNSISRAAIITMRSLFEEMMTIVLESREPQIAQQKLLWWQAELEQRLPNRQASHPITKALMILSDDFTFAIQDLIEINKTINADLHQLMYQTEDELNQFYQHSAGTLEASLSNVYQCQNIRTQETLRQLGVFNIMVQKLRDLRLSMQHGRTYLAAETLVNQHVTLQQLSTFTMTENIKSLFVYLASQAKIIYQNALQAIPVEDKQKILPSLILAKMHAVILEEIIHADYPVLTQRVSLTPLRKWWIAWRMNWRK